MKKFDIANKWFLAIFTFVIIGVIIAFLSVLFIKTSDDDDVSGGGDGDDNIRIPKGDDIVLNFNGASNIQIVAYPDSEDIPSPGEGAQPTTRNVVTYEIQRGKFGQVIELILNILTRLAIFEYFIRK